MLTEVDIESIDKYYQLKNQYEEEYEKIKKKHSIHQGTFLERTKEKSFEKKSEMCEL